MMRTESRQREGNVAEEAAAGGDGGGRVMRGRVMALRKYQRPMGISHLRKHLPRAPRARAPPPPPRVPPVRAFGV